MKTRLALIFLLGMACGAPAVAKNLGTIGQVFPIAEPDMLDFIAQRLDGMQKSGELDRLKAQAIARVKEHAVRPPPVRGLSPATVDRVTAYDPTFVANQTITDMQGNAIVHKGDRVNPLEKIPFNETLYFLDGDNKAQVKWVKAQLSQLATPFKVILVNGNIKDVSDALDERVYFDQAGVLTTKFGFEHTPVVVSRAENHLQVKEVALPPSGGTQ